MPLVLPLPAGFKTNPFILFFSPFLQSSKFFQTLAMGCESRHRRPFCFACSKPARLCLCSRFRSPPLQNAVAVTILQHVLEKDHPVNSTRVAKLGLKNLTVAPVSDINFQSWFFIRPLGKPTSVQRLDFYCVGEDRNGGNHAKGSDFSEDYRIDGKNCVEVGNSGNHGKGRDFVEGYRIDAEDCVNELENGGNLAKGCELSEGYQVDEKEKYKVMYSDNEVKIFFERNAKPDVRWLKDTLIGKEVVSDGFWVKKLQRKEVRLTKELEDFEEFEVLVPPGTALLFPSGDAVGLKEVDFEVKHLIVLDGTWSKAKRMYHENPWLQLLPHLKLESGKESLYSGVRTQPKEGYLSTIESIICALEELGEDKDGLEELLDVFDSMILDQKQCKADKFTALAEK